jgi:hypothetical protein
VFVGVMDGVTVWDGVTVDVTVGVGVLVGVLVGVAEGQGSQESHMFGVTLEIWVLKSKSITLSPIT